MARRNDPPPLMTLAEISTYLRISNEAARDLISRGTTDGIRLKATFVGRRVRSKREWVDAFLAQCDAAERERRAAKKAKAGCAQ